MRDATPQEVSRWDELIRSNPDGGHILQTRAWGEFKRMHGWLPQYLISDSAGARIAVLALQRGLPALGRMWYVPKGPGAADMEQLGSIIEQLRRRAGVFSVKLEPEIRENAGTLHGMQTLGLSKAAHDIQMSKATIIVDLRADDDQLLASFKPKTRYNIRLAMRKGVEVKPVPASDENVSVMHSLMGATQERAGFLLRPESYFRGYWQLQEAAGQGQLFFARWHGDVLAGVFATYLGGKAWYKDGGSAQAHREVMAPHLLQWEVMRWLRSRGVHSYDMVAVPPAAQLDESHPLYGLYRFKSGFADEIVEFVGTWELINAPLRRAVWEHAVERVQHQWALRVRHDLLY